MSADHPLAQAAARAGGGTDVVLSCDALGRRVDAAIAALTTLSDPTDFARQEIRGVLKEFGRASASVSGGEFSGYWKWYRNQIGAIRQAADRLFKGEDWVSDIRAPAWRSV